MIWWPGGAVLALAEQTVQEFEQSILPILTAKCQKCHGETTHKGGLTLTSLAGLLKGGESGEVVDFADREKSRLIEVLSGGEMPPEGEERLTPEELQKIKDWVHAADKNSLQKNIAAGPADLAMSHYRPLAILQLRCTVCHGHLATENDLDLRTRDGLLKGGKSGPAIVLGNPQESLLLKRVHSGEMPPLRRVVEVSIKPMEPSEIDILTRWIAAGAPLAPGVQSLAGTADDPLVREEDRQFWAFQPPRQPVLPAVRGNEKVRNPIDAFVLSKLEANGLTLAQQADKQSLLRRVYFDLTGLAPTPQETDAFLSDQRADAYERLVDQLLDSPQYAERWARYWLDLVGYSDSEGVQHSDPIRTSAYRYRDYVIRSLQSDKPYDRFLMEQIAGDELADYEAAGEITEQLADNLIATGFLRMAPDGTFSAITAFVPDRLEVIHQEMEILSSSVMGLTFRCARCHSHKFDPIPQRDYYRLLAIFKGAWDENAWLKPTPDGQGTLGTFGVRELPFVPTAERRAHEDHDRTITEAIAKEQAPLDARTAEVATAYTQKQIEMLPEAIRADVQVMLRTPPEQRTEVQKYLADKLETSLKGGREQFEAFDPKFKEFAQEIDKRIAALNGQRKSLPMVRALWDRGEPSPTYILTRGDYLTPGEPVGAGFPAVLAGDTPDLVDTPPWPGAKKTGRRLAFARWLTRADHPLTARVLVNRVWKHHFGQGLVKTLDNFGKTGTPPTHPELLDYLAVSFAQGGWSIKSLHRLMLCSQTYRQSSTVHEEVSAADPDNALLSRMPLRRLDAESLRDNLLHVTGQLDGTMFGPADPIESNEEGLVTSRPTEKGWRRSIYLLQRRTQVDSLLEAFDLPRMGPNCVERPISTVAPQALHLMNGKFVRELSTSFARHVRQVAGDDPALQVREIYRRAYSRNPEDAEMQIALLALEQLATAWKEKSQAESSANAGGEGTATNSHESLESVARMKSLESFCHAVLNSAEFLWID